MADGLPVPLLPSERLLWQGQPDPRKIFMPADAFLLPFRGFILAVSIFVAFGAVATEGPPFVLVPLAFFMALAGYLVVGRFLVKALRKTKTTYAVTDQRAIIHTPWSTREVRLSTAGIELATTRSGRHLTVIFTDPTLVNAASLYFLSVGRTSNSGTPGWRCSTAGIRLPSTMSRMSTACAWPSNPC